MSNLQRKAVYLAAVVALATAASAQKTSIRLPPDHSISQIKSAAGDDAVRKNCSFCHSTDYIAIQPHLTAQQWDAEVKKMIGVYGAPINPADAKTIADYLAKNYGAESADTKEIRNWKTVDPRYFHYNDARSATTRLSQVFEVELCNDRLHTNL